jgi:hypothetical protein
LGSTDLRGHFNAGYPLEILQIAAIVLSPTFGVAARVVCRLKLSPNTA